MSRRLKRSAIKFGHASNTVVTYAVVPAGHKWEVLKYYCYGTLGPGSFCGLLVESPTQALAWIHLSESAPATVVMRSFDVGGFPVFEGESVKAYYQDAQNGFGSHGFIYIDVDFT